jgi:hypothetical protein
MVHISQTGNIMHHIAHFNSSDSSLQFIICECGERILIVPNAKMMGTAIERHILERHKNKGSNKFEVDRLENALIAQLFEKSPQIR